MMESAKLWKGDYLCLFRRAGSAVERDCPYSKKGACETGDTIRRHNAQKTEVRSVCYPWHPWYGRSLVIRGSLVKNGLAGIPGMADPW
jgi:hypothetical protein